MSFSDDDLVSTPLSIVSNPSCSLDSLHLSWDSEASQSTTVSGYSTSLILSNCFNKFLHHYRYRKSLSSNSFIYFLNIYFKKWRRSYKKSISLTSSSHYITFLHHSNLLSSCFSTWLSNHTLSFIFVHKSILRRFFKNWKDKHLFSVNQIQEDLLVSCFLFKKNLKILNNSFNIWKVLYLSSLQLKVSKMAQNHYISNIKTKFFKKMMGFKNSSQELDQKIELFTKKFVSTYLLTWRTSLVYIKISHEFSRFHKINQLKSQMIEWKYATNLSKNCHKFFIFKYCYPIFYCTKLILPAKFLTLTFGKILMSNYLKLWKDSSKVKCFQNFKRKIYFEKLRQNFNFRFDICELFKSCNVLTRYFNFYKRAHSIICQLNSLDFYFQTHGSLFSRNISAQFFKIWRESFLVVNRHRLLNNYFFDWRDIFHLKILMEARDRIADRFRLKILFQNFKFPYFLSQKSVFLTPIITKSLINRSFNHWTLRSIKSRQISFFIQSCSCSKLRQYFNNWSKNLTLSRHLSINLNLIDEKSRMSLTTKYFTFWVKFSCNQKMIGQRYSDLLTRQHFKFWYDEHFLISSQFHLALKISERNIFAKILKNWTQTYQSFQLVQNFSSKFQRKLIINTWKTMNHSVEQSQFYFDLLSPIKSRISTEVAHFFLIKSNVNHSILQSGFSKWVRICQFKRSLKYLVKIFKCFKIWRQYFKIETAKKQASRRVFQSKCRNFQSNISIAQKGSETSRPIKSLLQHAYEIAPPRSSLNKIQKRKKKIQTEHEQIDRYTLMTLHDVAEVLENLD
ncbi:hypothetical protein RCL1_007229 [Eukaryota sp. TZLM3-RCL]